VLSGLPLYPRTLTLQEQGMFALGYYHERARRWGGKSTSLNDDAKKEIERTLTGVVHHGVRPLTVAEWRQLLESEGFGVESVETTSMSLLEPWRLVKDEGVMGAIRFALNVLKYGEARRRVFEMRRTFRRNRKLLAAVALVGIKR